MPKSVIIVESPAKTKTIKSFLGRGFSVVGSMGHVRDLPKSRLGVEVEEGFTPKYVIPTAKRKTVTALKKAVKDADQVYLATDPDREGESIAWHLAEALKLKSARRIEFNEITKRAVQRSLETPREINMNRVNAQQARRVLDRLVGYKLSPLLWRKLGRRNLSAGRVQSVAVRLVCDREREIAAFNPEEYWTLTAEFQPDGERDSFKARLTKVDGQKANPKREAEAQELVEGLRQVTEFRIAQITQRDQRRKPPAPFITSTLQQEAARRLYFSARKTMSVAQQLYEGIAVGQQAAEGLITYMRTDSTRIADEAKAQARQLIGDTYGADYVGEGTARSRGRNVQDAHEAIRPTDLTRRPESLKPYLSSEQYRLYDLIWRRFLASQMAPAVIARTAVTILGGRFELRANGSRTKFPGFLQVWEESKKKTGDANGEQSADGENDRDLPALAENESVGLKELLPEQHFTKPPPRYSEASLVRALEAKGIGRPSTYAPILGTIVDRGYVELQQRRFHATELGLEVTDRLVEHFPDVLDTDFTARVEGDLDEVEGGTRDWVDVLSKFYTSFEADLERAMEQMQKVEPQETDIDCPREDCEGKMLVRHSRYGDFLGCSKYPDCTEKMQVPAKEGEESSAAPGESAPPLPPTDAPCPKCGAPLEVRNGRFGPFYGCTKFRETGCKGIVNAPSAAICDCPQCKQGKIVQKRSRKGKSFFACDQYPDCKFALWNKPTGERCPECGDLLVERTRRDGGDYVACSRKGCSGGQAPEAK